MDLGTYIQYEDKPAVRFQRTYPHSVQRVWAAVSDPSELAHWFPQRVTIDKRTGGAIEFDADPNAEPMRGTVLSFDPPKRIAFSWGTDELHFDLEPAPDGGCTLTMINVLGAQDTAARNAAGWTVCLAELDKLLSGQPTHGPHSAQAMEWQPVYDVYVSAGMPSGAPIPTPQAD